MSLQQVYKVIGQNKIQHFYADSYEGPSTYLRIQTIITVPEDYLQLHQLSVRI